MKDKTAFEKKITLSIYCVLLLTFIQLHAEIYYVASNGSPLNSGKIDSPWSLAKANSSLQAGDTAILLDGNYTDIPIAPDNSGDEGQYISYLAANKQMAVFQNISELPNSNGPVAIFVNNKSYIKIDGIKVLNVKRWLYGVSCNHITIANGHFENATGWINCRFEQNGDGIKIINNYFHNGTDLVQVDGGDGHIIENNFFGDASHTGLVLLGVQKSIIRNNFLTNRLWRCMEVESRRIEPYRLSEYNLIENNTFDFSPNGSIQYAGNRSILRRNIFRKSLEGMGWANYLGSAKTPEAWHDESNRFYNNVITECGTHSVVLDIIAQNEANGIKVAESVSDVGYAMSYKTNLFNPENPNHPDPGNCAYGDNIIKNNIFYMNANTSDSRSSNTACIAFDWNATPEFGRYYNNDIFYGNVNADVFFYQDADYQENPPEPKNRSISSFQERYPEWAFGNIEVDPKFADPAEIDYHLIAGSPCIDTGGSMTYAVLKGNGNTIQVEDALYFCDGYGLADADYIFIDSVRVKILSIDYETNSITLEEEIAWEDSALIYADYEGNGPDIGAFEYTDSQTGFGYNVKIPDSMELYQNFPNPFNPQTKINYVLHSSGQIALNVYNLLGQKVKTIINETKRPGLYTAIWDGKDDSGVSQASGVYLFELDNGKQKIVNKSILLK